MKTTIIPAALSGTIDAIPSKSHAHRLLICSALASGKTELECSSSSNDIDATIRCLQALGMTITKSKYGFTVNNPEKGKAYVESLKNVKNDISTLLCGESGSTYRFLFPVVCAVSTAEQNSVSDGNAHKFSFSLEGRLPERPMGPLFSVLEEHGIKISGEGTSIVSVSGKLTGGTFTVPGNISSQFITGLLLALPLLEEDSIIEMTGKIESRAYIDITLDAIRTFGIKVIEEDNRFMIPGGQSYVSPKEMKVEGDWSNAAFWLCASALSGRSITCNGLNPDSIQGDKKICDVLEAFGGHIDVKGDSITYKPQRLNGITVDASQIPDLVPAIAAVAAGAHGTTQIINAERLRIKESDRLKAIENVLTILGADVQETADGLIIKGEKILRGGNVDSWNDHRIAMMASIISILSDYPVKIENSQAINKSYPGFFKDFTHLGGKTL